MPESQQSFYQVRFDWGAAGAAAIGSDADVIVLVDVLPDTPAVDLGATTAPVVAGGLRNRTAVAEWVLEQQGDKGDRFVVAVIAAGARDAERAFVVEDLLGAGAVIDALADVGIDYVSPEAAVAAAAFTGMPNAIGALIAAGVGGRALAADGRRAELEAATAKDPDPEVPRLR